jgi:hypothetical protein
MARLHRLPDRSSEAAKTAELHRTALAALTDAQRPENGLRTRTDLAFDAVYGLCLHFARKKGCRLHEPHPSAVALIYAECCMSAAPQEAYAPAYAYLDERYSLDVAPGRLEALLNLAKSLERALQ